MAGEKALKPLINMERETGFEPATLALARLFSINHSDQVFPLLVVFKRIFLFHPADILHENHEIFRASSTNLAHTIPNIRRFS